LAALSSPDGSKFDHALGLELSDLLLSLFPPPLSPPPAPKRIVRMLIVNFS